MNNTRLTITNRVRWTVSLICIVLILLAGAAATVACVRPDWVSGVKKALFRSGRSAVTVTTDENFPFKQSDDELTRIVSAGGGLRAGGSDHPLRPQGPLL